MTAAQRAHQIWPLLALAATTRQILTYQLVGRLIGVPQQALGQLLEPIQSYCLMRDLPPLSILVVRKDDGMPGSGFSAATDIPRNQATVFAYDWLGHGCPTPDEFADAVSSRPSNGV